MSCVRCLAAGWVVLLLLAQTPAAWADEAAGVGAADAEGSAERSVDPWQPMNRKIFAFNEAVDRYFLEPVATGWDRVVPDPVQHSISNFFENLQMPVHMANDLLQLKPWDAYQTAWRIVINSVAGIGGLFDPASHFDIYKSDEDFGQTLGYWGVPSGPYLVLPLLGPSSPRDTVGMVVDRAPSVVFYFVPVPTYVTVPTSAVNVVNARAGSLEEIREERESAIDFYVFVRSAYTQYRENRVHDRVEQPKKGGENENLYYLDEDDQDE